MGMKQTDQQSVAVKVNIFDRTYSLRSFKDEEHVLSIARLVDERMRKISEHMTTLDPAWIAVLAALNIADELEELKAQYERAEPFEKGANFPGHEKSQTWFEEIFNAGDDPETTGERRERLSSQVSNKLKALRREDPKPINLSLEGEE
jgi:cell division protein ZapA (FtsZ GTPase activity inhibitor)